MSYATGFSIGEQVEIIRPIGYVAETLLDKRARFIGQIATITNSAYDELTDSLWYHINVGSQATMWNQRWFQPISTNVNVDVETLL